jgi:hypothetical protein
MKLGWKAIIAAWIISFPFFGQETVGWAAPFHYDRNLTPELTQTLDRAMESLERQAGVTDFPDSTLSLMGLGFGLGFRQHAVSTEAQSLQTWIQSRIQYITNELDLSESVFIADESHSYENPGVFPPRENKKTPRIPQGKVSVLMSNLGAGIYTVGKYSSVLYGVILADSTEVILSSPRAGLLQVGPGLISPRTLPNKDDPAALTNSLFVLATLFHEARHSDGHGQSLGFPHAICPKGHNYEGYAACDFNLNGPYTVGAQVLKTYTEACGKDCTIPEREALRLRYLDSFDRVIKSRKLSLGRKEKATAWDPAPEGVQ